MIKVDSEFHCCACLFLAHLHRERFSLLTNRDDMQSINDAPRALQQLDDFAIASLNALVELESPRNAGPITLRYMARLDISLVANEMGKLSYYINEVTRMPGAMMFSRVGNGGGQQIHHWVPTFAQAISDMMLWHHKHQRGPNRNQVEASATT